MSARSHTSNAQGGSRPVLQGLGEASAAQSRTEMTKPQYPECVFCGKPNRPSKEDVLAKWIARRFPDRAKSRFDIRRGRLGEPSWPDQEFVAVGNLGSVVRAPCVRCNSGWMSTLERESQPILEPLMDGESGTVPIAHLRVIAQWAVKTALMYEYMRYTEEARYFTTADRRALCWSLTLPPNTLVFAARYAGESGTYQIGGHSSTIAIQQLALQVFSYRWLPEYRGARTTPVLSDTWSDIQKSIWPTLEPMYWPPRLALDDLGFEEFATRWRQVG
jgi:hypothetical protein